MRLLLRTLQILSVLEFGFFYPSIMLCFLSVHDKCLEVLAIVCLPYLVSSRLPVFEKVLGLCLLQVFQILLLTFPDCFFLFK